MSSGLNSLATIIKRLEAATSRLEDLAVENGRKGTNAVAPPESSNGSGSSSTIPPPPPPPPPSSSSTAAVIVEIPPSVIAFDEVVVDSKLKPFLELTRSFAGSSVVEQAALVENMFADLRSVLLMAASCKKPDQGAFGELLRPLQGDIEAISRLKEANRKDREWFTHLSTIAEGAPAVGWVTAEPKPGPYVADIKESIQYYGNRVMTEFKEKDPRHAEWVRAYTGILEEMQKYVMKYHTTGLAWNANGIVVADYRAQSSSASADIGAPPPPPPPPPPAVQAPPIGGSPDAGGVAAVFAEINRGADVTKGLRKVDKSEMTHKNPSLRTSSVVPASPSSSPSAPKKPLKPSKPHALAGKKPAKLALEGNKWAIEYQENEPNLTVAETERSQTVNLYGCKNSTVVIKGKINGVTIVNCTKVSVLVESVISAISITKSPSFTLQITGTVPTIQLDSTDSGQIYLCKECLDVEITSAKCSSINVSLPVPGEEEGVFEEQPIPEMFITTVKDGKLVTAIVEHVG